ncbi:hypothetical protein B8W69_00460 [Mycobacterium vulneris]|uniref:Oxidoreductase n=1 Tax=Mycolicibacterium vulneris TaxID=547163 RepID=A0A1X2LFN7_9MYCO|nr:hypothetical protein [Mycolicibacterium vulneris]OSC32303.1 hypothetical protein B8W69_00460 [Mycolicibacterium vulneris]
MNLTDDEQKLLRCVEVGSPYFGSNATIRGSVIRAIAIGELVAKPNPNGINIACAKIKDALILLNVSTDLQLHFKACSFEKTILATGARIPILRFENCQLHASMGPAIGAEGLKVSGGFTMHDCTVEVREANAAIELDNCEVGGHLSFQRTVVINPAGQCISGDRAKIGSNLTLAGVRAKSGGGNLGAIRFSIAEIGGKINFTEDSSIESHGGPAAVFDGTKTGDNFHAIGLTAHASAAKQGTLRLDAMDIGGQLVLHRCGVANQSSVAVSADRLRVHGSVMIGPETWIYGSGPSAALRLMGAKVDGNLSFENTAIFNGTGPAIAAETAVVDGHLHLNGGLRVEGAGSEGVIRLGGAYVGRRLQADAAGTAIPCGGLVLDLGDTTVGRLELNPRFVDDNSRWLNIDRLSYTGLPMGATRSQWISLVRDNTTDYSPQAWRQLSDAYRNAGHDNDARRVLFAQQRDRADRTLRPAGRESEGRFRLWMQRRWLAILRVTIGYGYQVGRALVWLAVIAILSVALGLVAGNVAYRGELTATRQSAPGTAPSACSSVEQVGLGLGIGLPLIKQATPDNCHVNTVNPLGQLVTVAGWVLQLVAWVFATLFIAGFTKVIRVN